MKHGHKTNSDFLDMWHLWFLASHRCWNCLGTGGKGIAGAGAKGEMSDQGKKGGGKQWHAKGQPKDMWVNSGRQTQAPQTASHTEVTVKFYPTNSGSNKVLPRVMETTTEFKMVAKELDGKPTVKCLFRPKDSKFQESHCHSKGTQQLECMRMRSGGQRAVSNNSNQIFQL